MLPRERVLRALDFEKPDVVPVEYHPSGAGLYDHGEELRRLMQDTGHDFGDGSSLHVSAPDPRFVDTDGRYCERRTDDWGVVWEHLIYGVAGHPIERPLDDWRNLSDYRAPAAPVASGSDFDEAREAAASHMQRSFLKSGWVTVFEVMHAVRRFEDVLMDITCDGPEINRLADLITDHREREIEHLLARGTDAIQFADDFGTQEGLLLSPAAWRAFFKPRYERLVRPVREAGKKAFFHSCGMVAGLLDDLAEIGFDAIWPQVPLYDAGELAARCRDLGLAVAIHPDRSHLMTSGTPEDVRASVRDLAEAFKIDEGGSWFYVEIDNGFPFDNTRALVESIHSMRNGAG